MLGYGDNGGRMKLQSSFSPLTASTRQHSLNHPLQPNLVILNNS